MRLIVSLILALFFIASQAQGALSNAQLATVCTAVKADATANAARTAQDTVSLLAWLNATKSPAFAAWRVDMQPAESDEAATYTLFDSILAGKRDSWRIFITFPRNYSKNKIRNWVVDVWGSATAGSTAEGILQAATYNASNAQAAIGGNSKTTGTVTATDLNFTGLASSVDATWLVQPANCP